MLEQLEYVVEHFCQNSRFINDISGLEKYMEDQKLSTVEKTFILEEVFNYNQKIYNLMAEENTKLEKIISRVSVVKDLKELNIPVKEELKKENNIITLNIDAKEYINKIKRNDNLEEIKSLLPIKGTLNYNHIINIIILSLYEDIIDYKKMLLEDKHIMNEEEIDVFQNEINQLMLKINYLKTLNKVVPKVQKEQEEPQNDFIFLQTKSGNYSIFSDIKEIAFEHYYLFETLLKEMKNNKFRNIKYISNNDALQDTIEVKYNQARITFVKLRKNKYVILDMFIKKVQTNAIYKASLKNKIDLYRENYKVINDLIDNESFIDDNNKIFEQVLKILSKEPKTKKLGGNYE